jgi:hypothetical protein
MDRYNCLFQTFDKFEALIAPLSREVESAGMYGQLHLTLRT